MTPSPASSATAVSRRRFAGLALGSVGVVYGDIGTSPLYALREALRHAAEDGLSRAEVLGVVSLLLWALIAIVTFKYVLFLLRMDNRGEGGLLSLLALVQAAVGRRPSLLLITAVAGAALFFGDATITPAISVLSAVEGLAVAAPDLEPYVLPLTVMILAILFSVQSRGTGAVALWFGPIMTVWFLVLAVGGAAHLSDDLAVLYAFDPRHALRFLWLHGWIGLLVLGAVFLAVTGAEALFADLGHFGRGPVRAAWFALVFPALALNYLGQGAFVLSDPRGLANPFFLMYPSWALLPMVALATAATVIASQAVITGAFSLTRQAIQLGLLPRFEIRHTSETQIGQIYLPRANRLLLIAVLALVLVFESSGSLASAYGVAVSGEMLLATVLAFAVVWKVWRWPLGLAAIVVAPILLLEAAFLSANLLKVLSGGVVPLVMAAAIAVVIWTWMRGMELLLKRSRQNRVALADLIEMLERRPPHECPGTAVFLVRDPETAPVALLHNLKHNRVLHRHNVIMAIRTADVPRVAAAQRVEIEPLGDRFTKVVATFGYMETPDVPQILGQCRRNGLKFSIAEVSFFLGRRSIHSTGDSDMPLWQQRLFIVLAADATHASDFFRLPPGRVIELGERVTV